MLDTRNVSKVEAAAIAAFMRFMQLIGGPQTYDSTSLKKDDWNPSFTITQTSTNSRYEFGYMNAHRQEWPAPFVLFIDRYVNNEQRSHSFGVRQHRGNYAFIPEDRLKDGLPDADLDQIQLIMEFLNDPSRGSRIGL